MGVFSALEDYDTEELLRIVIDCDNMAEQRVKAAMPKNAPDYRWWIFREGAGIFKRKLGLCELSVLVPRKLLPDHVQALLGAIPQPQPKAAPIRQQKAKPKLHQFRPVNMGRMWINDPLAPPPMPRIEAAPVEELRNALFNYHEEVVANMARVVPIAQGEVYQDPF